MLGFRISLCAPPPGRTLWLMLHPKMSAHRRVIWLVVLGCAVTSRAFAGPSRVDGENVEDREIQAAAPDRPKDMPLAILPEPRSLDLPPPRPEALETIDELLQAVTGTDAQGRMRAQALLARAKSDWVSALERRADRLAERADRGKMKARFEHSLTLAKQSADGADGDYLNELLAYADPADASWREVVQLLAINRMLTAIGSADAARVVIFIYVRFGEFMRIDCQRQLDAIGERANAALIDALRHPAPKIAAWAQRLLSLRHKLDPHDAVRTTDSTALGDTLVALGRSRDPQLTNLLLSFAASDRAGVRRAAREGLVMVGEAGAWQLKDAYQNITGKLPPRDWTWKRTARELFTEYDRLELEEAYALLAQGEQARAKKDYASMLTSFNKLLARLPSFQETRPLADGYLEAAIANKDSHADLAFDAAFRAEQLLVDPGQKQKAEALRRLLEAQRLQATGWIDQTELKRARTLDPTLRAESEQLSHAHTKSQTWGSTSRYLIAGVISLLALTGAGWVFVSVVFRRGSVPSVAAAKPPSPPPNGPPAAVDSSRGPEPPT